MAAPRRPQPSPLHLISLLLHALTWTNIMTFPGLTSATPLPPSSHYELLVHRQEQSETPTIGIERVAAPVVIDPEGVYIRATPLRHTNGTIKGIIAGFATTIPGTPSRKVLRVALSTDSGTSWSPLGEVTSVSNPALHDLDNAYPLQLPSGRILVAFRNHDRRASDGAYTHYRITVCYSDDGGKTWGFLSQVAERPANSDDPDKLNGLWEPLLRVAMDGRTVQCYYSAEKDARADQDNVMRYSTDGGKTWSGEVVVSGGELSNSRDGMVGVAEVDGRGTLIAVFEETELGPARFAVSRVISRDDGYTWGERARVYTASGAGKTAGAPQVTNVGGRLVTSFMTNEGSGTPELDGGEMKVVTSVDGGRTWSSTSGGGMVTGEKGSHWPGMYSLDGQHFLALYSRDGWGAVSHLYRLV